MYETPSSTPDRPKSRIVFILDQELTNAEDYRIAQVAMWSKFGATDLQVTDPARFFYGRPGAHYIALSNVLYGDVLQTQVVEPHPLNVDAAGTNGLAAPVFGPILEEHRNTALSSMAGTMRRRRFGEAAILAALTVENAERCIPPLSQDEVRAIARSIGRYRAGESAPQSTVPFRRKGRIYLPRVEVFH